MNNSLNCQTMAFVVLFALFLCGCATEASRLEVTPGVGIGDIQLNDLRVDVLTKMGTPIQSESKHVADSLMQDEWSLGGNTLMTILFHNDRVIQIKVEGPGYVVPSGVGPESAIEEIRNVYPNLAASVMAHDLENMYLDSVDEGIAFSIRGGYEGEHTNEAGDYISAFVHPVGQEVIAIVHHHDAHH